MKVDDGVCHMTVEEYIEMTKRVLSGDGFVHQHTEKHADPTNATHTTVKWGFEVEADEVDVLEEMHNREEVQARLRRLLNMEASSVLADTLYEQLGDEAHTNEYMALQADDETVKARRQGIATGIRLAQAMVHEEAP